MAIPSLAMIPSGYKATKLYSVLPTSGVGDFTVSRASTATRVNSAGFIETVGADVPRLDYSDGGCPVLLTEPQSTNLLPYSNDFTNVAWIKARTTINLESVLNPENNSNTYYLKEDNTTNSHELYQGAKSITAGSLVTASIYFKRKIGSADRFLRLQINDDTFTDGARVLFDIQNGTIALQVLNIGLGTQGSAKIESVGNGWYRASLTCKINDVSTLARVNNYLQENGLGFFASYLGDNVSGCYVYGTQLEALPYQTSYIPTEGTAITRVADVVSETDLYTNGLITSSGGTWFVELINNEDLIRAASSNMFLGTSSNGNDTALVIRSGSATSTRLSIGTRVSGTTNSSELITTETAKVLFKWNGSTVDTFINGTKVDAGTSFPFTELNFLVIDGVDVPKYIKQMQIYSSPLTDLECQTLTTL